MTEVTRRSFPPLPTQRVVTQLNHLMERPMAQLGQAKLPVDTFHSGDANANHGRSSSRAPRGQEDTFNGERRDDHQTRAHHLPFTGPPRSEVNGIQPSHHRIWGDPQSFPDPQGEKHVELEHWARSVTSDVKTSTSTKSTPHVNAVELPHVPDGTSPSTINIQLSTIDEISTTAVDSSPQKLRVNPCQSLEVQDSYRNDQHRNRRFSNYTQGSDNNRDNRSRGRANWKGNTDIRPSSSPNYNRQQGGQNGQRPLQHPHSRQRRSNSGPISPLEPITNHRPSSAGSFSHAHSPSSAISNDTVPVFQELPLAVAHDHPYHPALRRVLANVYKNDRAVTKKAIEGGRHAWFDECAIHICRLVKTMETKQALFVTFGKYGNVAAVEYSPQNISGDYTTARILYHDRVAAIRAREEMNGKVRNGATIKVVERMVQATDVQVLEMFMTPNNCLIPAEIAAQWTPPMAPDTTWDMSPPAISMSPPISGVPWPTLPPQLPPQINNGATGPTIHAPSPAPPIAGAQTQPFHFPSHVKGQATFTGFPPSMLYIPWPIPYGHQQPYFPYPSTYTPFIQPDQKASLGASTPQYILPQGYSIPYGVPYGQVPMIHSPLPQLPPTPVITPADAIAFNQPPPSVERPLTPPILEVKKENFGAEPGMNPKLCVEINGTYTAFYDPVEFEAYCCHFELDKEVLLHPRGPLRLLDPDGKVPASL